MIIHNFATAHFLLNRSECLMLMGFDNGEIDKLKVIHSIVIVPKDNYIYIWKIKCYCFDVIYKSITVG